jgi:hypothetical protein
VSNHDLIIYSDSAASVEVLSQVEKVREYIKTIVGFRSVTIYYRPSNYGLSKSIINGVSEVLSRYERIIVLEDDMLTSSRFLSYVNEALDRFAEDDRVVSVHGYVYPVENDLPDAFFLRGSDCWGWATWRRGWEIFNPDGKELISELRRLNLTTAFNFNDAYPYSEMLINQINGLNDSWAIRWYASTFIADKLTLYPGRSLVHNIGNDNSGTHCEASNIYEVKISELPVNLKMLQVSESENARRAFEFYFKKTNGNLLKKIVCIFKAKIMNVFQ